MTPPAASVGTQAMHPSLQPGDLPEQLVWHLIFVRGVVDLVLPFAWSLLGRLPGRLRLVANGTTAAEDATLRVFAARDGRMEFVSLQSPVVLRHGDALHRLLDHCKESWFACIDSDIFVPVDGSAGPLFAPDLADLLKSADALYSCLPIWQRPGETVLPAHFTWAIGRCAQTSNGYLTGVTYCMLYRAAVLRTTLQRWNVRLTPYRWKQIPSPLRVELQRRNLRKRFYDSAKVVNLALAVDGARMLLIDAPGLVHVGAASGNRPSRRGVESPRRKSFAQQGVMLAKRAGRRLLGQRLYTMRKGVGWGEAQSHTLLIARRRAAQAVLEGNPLPVTLEPEMAPRFEYLRGQIAAVRAAFTAATLQSAADEGGASIAITLAGQPDAMRSIPMTSDERAAPSNGNPPVSAPPVAPTASLASSAPRAASQ